MRVLVIEDDQETANFLKRALKEQGHVAEYAADEAMIVTITHDHAARVRSYELIAAEFGARMDAARQEEDLPRSYAESLSRV